MREVSQYLPADGYKWVNVEEEYEEMKANDDETKMFIIWKQNSI